MVGAAGLCDQGPKQLAAAGFARRGWELLLEKGRPEVIMLGAAERTSGRYYAATLENCGMISSPYAFSVSSCPWVMR
jgi:hypothetical protein